MLRFFPLMNISEGSDLYSMVEQFDLGLVYGIWNLWMNDSIAIWEIIFISNTKNYIETNNWFTMAISILLEYKLMVVLLLYL